MILSSLGNLNSELLSAHYGDTTPTVQHVQRMLKNARALHQRAQNDHNMATKQDRFNQEERNLSNHATLARHIAKHTMLPNSICTGPCLHVNKKLHDAIQPDLNEIHGPNRKHAVNSLATKLENLSHSTSSPSDPRLCEGTQISCIVGRFQDSYDYTHTPSTTRGEMTKQVLQEAQYTLKMATEIANSQIRELEAGETQFELGGGGVPNQSIESISDFFRVHQLGRPPNTENFRIALDSVLISVAPRAKTAVKNNLWGKFLSLNDDY